MLWDKYQLPTEPPALQQPVTLTEAERVEAERILNNLSTALNALPVVLSQQGSVECAARTTKAEAAERIAQASHRIWQEGATCPAREVIRFAEEAIGEPPERTNVMIYSAHVTGALTLSIGWRPSISLTQLRAEAADAGRELRRLLGV